MEKKEKLYAIIDDLCEVVQNTSVTEIASDFESFKERSNALFAGAQAFASLVRIAELIKNK